MRSLTLANALRRHGVRTHFVCRQLPAHLQELTAGAGHALTMLDSASSPPATAPHAVWPAATQEADALDTRDALTHEGGTVDWLVADHYALDARWAGALRAATRRILVIDDLANRHHECDILLDQNLYANAGSRYATLTPAGCRTLLGPRYALLRPEFRRERERRAARDGTAKRLLVFFGGADAGDLTSQAIAALRLLGPKLLHVDVIIGASHPRAESVRDACGELGLTCHVQTSNVAALMAAADLAVGAGGTAVWERCSVGLPTLTFVTADNQRQQVADAAAAGLLYAPEARDGVADVIARHLRALLENPNLLRAISTAGSRTVDARGTGRVIAAMGVSSVTMRPATLDDAHRLFEWRNHPRIRQVSRDASEIPWDQHQRWLRAVLSDTGRHLLIGERDGHAVGVVRFDTGSTEAEVSIYLVPDASEPGTGQDLLCSAERWLVAHAPSVTMLRAEVLGHNERSHGLFTASGYRLASSSYSKILPRP